MPRVSELATILTNEQSVPVHVRLRRNKPLSAVASRSALFVSRKGGTRSDRQECLIIRKEIPAVISNRSTV